MKQIKLQQYFQLLKHNNDFILGPRTFLRNAWTDHGKQFSTLLCAWEEILDPNIGVLCFVKEIKFLI